VVRQLDCYSCCLAAPPSLFRPTVLCIVVMQYINIETYNLLTFGQINDDDYSNPKVNEIAIACRPHT